MSNEDLEPSLIDAFLWDSRMADEQTFWEDVPVGLMRSKSSRVLPLSLGDPTGAVVFVDMGSSSLGRPPECLMCRSDDWGRAAKPLRRAS